MSQIFAIVALIAIAVCWFYWDKSKDLVDANAAFAASVASMEKKAALDKEAFEAVQEAMEELREQHEEAVKQRDKYLAAFDGDAFAESIIAQPDVYEEKINRASGYVVERVEAASANKEWTKGERNASG